MNVDLVADFRIAVPHGVETSNGIRSTWFIRRVVDV